MSSKKQPNLEDLLFFISKKGNRVALSSIVRISPTTIYLNTGSTLNIKDSEDLAQLETKLVAFEEYKLSKQQADLDAKIAKLTKADIAEHTEVLKEHLTDVFNTILKQSEQTSEKVTSVVNNQISLVETLTTNISNLSSQMTRLTSNGEDLTSMMEAITKTKTELEGTIKLLKECLDV
jgi:phage-related minor tail protein